LEEKPTRENSLYKIEGEILKVAEAEEAVVVVPVVLEVAQVELEIVVRVPVHVRNPVVAVGTLPKLCTIGHQYHRKRHRPPSEFYSEP
jgi:hypothetical protein